MELQVIKELLKEGGSLKVLVRGNSMRPYLIHERDYVVLRKLDSVKVGDIVLAEVTPGYFVLHRLVNIEGDKITLRGDGNVKTEHGKLGDVCGTVVGFYRKGGQALEKPDTLKYKIFTFLWTHTLPWRSFMLRVHHLFFESCKDLKRITPSENDVEAFLQLLRHALWGTEIKQDFHGVCWEAICQLATEQTVQGLIADAINHLPNDARPKGKEAFRLINTTFNLMYTHQRLNADIVKVFTFLKENHFTPILFKGQGNATFYPNPQLRQCGDIDVYIGRKDYKRACDCVMARLHQQAIQAETGESRKHFHISTDTRDVELHKVAEVQANPLLHQRYLRLTEKWLTPALADSVQLGGMEIMIPPLQFNVVFVFNHTWHHFLKGGIGLRQICDLSMILHHACGKINLEELQNNLKSLHLMRGWQIIGWIAVNKLGLSSSEMPFHGGKYEKEAQSVWNMILNGGNFGSYRLVSPTVIKGNLMKQKIRNFIITNIQFMRILSIAPENVISEYIKWLTDGVTEIFKILKNNIKSHAKKNRYSKASGLR